VKWDTQTHTAQDAGRRAVNVLAIVLVISGNACCAISPSRRASFAAPDRYRGSSDVPSE